MGAFYTQSLGERSALLTEEKRNQLVGAPIRSGTEPGLGPAGGYSRTWQPNTIPPDQRGNGYGPQPPAPGHVMGDHGLHTGQGRPTIGQGMPSGHQMGDHGRHNSRK